MLNKQKEPVLVQVIPPANQSFVVKKSALPPVEKWHFHNDYEIILCVKGKGHFFIGNQVREVGEGDLILIGAKVPHASQKDKNYYDFNPQAESLEWVVQFGEKIINRDFFSLQEFDHIRDLLDRANRVLIFNGNTRSSVAPIIASLHQLEPTLCLLRILEVLDLLARSSEFDYLLPVSFNLHLDLHQDERLNRVFEYTLKNLAEDIYLEAVADVAIMAPAAFCRYFKKHTRKAYFEYLTEVRISHACDLLLHTNDTISNIIFQSGFHSISNFNRQFREVMNMTPQEYRKKFASTILQNPLP